MARSSFIQDVAELEIAFPTECAPFVHVPDMAKSKHKLARFGRLARGIRMFARFVPQTVAAALASTAPWVLSIISDLRSATSLARVTHLRPV